jgi:hypothetical protein
MGLRNVGDRERLTAAAILQNEPYSKRVIGVGDRRRMSKTKLRRNGNGFHDIGSWNGKYDGLSR